MTNGNKRNKVCKYLNFNLFPLDYGQLSTFLSTNLYLPMQKFLKMFPSISSVEISPVMEPRW